MWSRFATVMLLSCAGCATLSAPTPLGKPRPTAKASTAVPPPSSAPAMTPSYAGAAIACDGPRR